LVTHGSARRSASSVFQLGYNDRAADHHVISLLPGPVEIDAEITAAFHLPPISHRSLEFISHFEAVRARLLEMTGARRAALLHGSGTLANEAVVACLDGPGVVLVNGEFGARLARQARRWDLPARVLEWPWGTPWDLDRVAGELDGAGWIWGVHLETSTGMLNDVASLGDLARSRGVRLCLDCVSSLGAVPLNLERVWLASGVSGKALGSYAGVAIVFASEQPESPRNVPVYLDVAAALRTEGPCFTFPSSSVLALECAIRRERDYARLGCLVRRRLREMGAPPLVEECFAAPTVTTFVPPAEGFMERCRRLGYSIGGESPYLTERGFVQIANMGAVRADQIDSLFDQLALLGSDKESSRDVSLQES
jgi:aspartate aminotransferase-like enzyme